MLYCARVDVLNAVKLCVIVNKPIDVGEIQATEVGLLEDGEVGVVWKYAVDVIRKRSRYRIWRRPGELPDETAVLLAGLEHDHRPAIAACVEIEYCPDVFGPPVLRHEGARSQQTKLFSICEEKNYIILQRLARL